MGRFIVAFGLVLGGRTIVRAQSVAGPAQHGAIVGLTVDQYYAGRPRAHGISFRGTGPGRSGVTSSFAAGFRIGALKRGYLANGAHYLWLISAGFTTLPRSPPGVTGPGDASAAELRCRTE